MGVCAGKQKRAINERNRQRNGEQQRLLIGIEEAPSNTKLYDIPLEMLDLILQKSYLHWTLNSSEKQRDEEVIMSLISVDVCFNRRITRQRFKKAIWRYLRVAVRVTVINHGGKIAETVFTQLIHQRMNDLRNIINLKSHETNKRVRLLRNKDIEILNSQRNRQTVDVWIWCRTQAALEHIQNLYESNRMREVFFDQIQPSTSMVIRIERNQFKKNAVVNPNCIKINFTQRIKQQESLWGMTKLRNEIFVLSVRKEYAIRVFEDRCPFHLRRSISIKQIKAPIDIGSSEKLNCLYVSDSEGYCIWKITKEKGDEYKVMKWLTTDHEPNTISVSVDGNLLMVNPSRPMLMKYGSDAYVPVLIRSIRLPTDIEDPIHAVETSIGNFIILHSLRVKAEHWSGVGDREKNWGVSELARDGQQVIRSFFPAHESQELNIPQYISLDSDNRVFVADTPNGRVILLESDLQWNQIISPSEEELNASRSLPWRLFYDKKNKQLIVGEYSSGFTIYTLSQN